jgi:hypothetical protein
MLIITQAENVSNLLRPLLDVALCEQALWRRSFAFPGGGSDEQTSA